MKTTILLLLSAALGFAEVAPAPVPAEAAPADATTATPAPPESHAEPATPAPPETRAEPATPAPPETRAEPATPTPPETHAEPATHAPPESHAEPATHAEPVSIVSVDSVKTPTDHDPEEASPAPGPTTDAIAPRSPDCASGPHGRRKAALQSRVTLTDGSVLKGTLLRRFLPADTKSLGRIRIDLRAVASIDAGAPQRGAPARYRVTFKNGDRLTVGFPADMKPLPFDTVIGRVLLPLSAVSKLVLDNPSPHSSLVTRRSSLLYHCTFDDAAAIERPAAGPAGTFLGGSFVPGKVGRALRVEADTPAFESKFPKGFLGPEGCLEFWAKIEGDDPRYVDGGDPLFVSLCDERGAITLLQFAANNGFARGGLGGAFASWPFGTIPRYAGSMEYRKVLGKNWAGWHHYAMSWKAGGFGDGSFVKVFVDGRPQPVLGGVDDDKLPARLANYANHSHDLGIPWSTARSADRRRSKKPFLVDDLKIWSVAKTDFAFSTLQTPNRRTTKLPKLLYHCTFDDAQSIEHPAAGPAGTFLGGEFVPGKKGNALLVKARTPAAEVPFPTGLMQPEGCIEFWAKIPGATKDTRYPDGGNPQFFAMGVGPWVNTLVKYTANDGFGTGGLHADLPGSAYVSSAPSVGDGRYPDFLGDPAAWHHYALVWSEKGLDGASEALGRRIVSALYVDGRLVNPAYGTNGPDRAKFLRQFTDLPVILGFPFLRERQTPNQSQVDFLIDEFKIWSVPKFDTAGAAVVPVRQYKPELIYHCTFDSAEAIERPAAGPSGTFLGGEFVPGKKGRALRTFADEPAAEVDFEPGFLGTRGTIEFWAKMEEATKETVFGDGGNPRFFCLWVAEDINRPGRNPRSSYLQWSGNDGCGRSGLCAMIQKTTATSDDGYGMRHYPSFLGDPAAWHHYAVVWDECGVDDSDAVLSIYVDGKRLQSGGYSELFRGKGFCRFLESSVLLGFPQRKNEREPASRHIPFLIDEFKIWSAPVVRPRPRPVHND